MQNRCMRRVAVALGCRGLANSVCERNPERQRRLMILRVGTGGYPGDLMQSGHVAGSHQGVVIRAAARS